MMSPTNNMKKQLLDMYKILNEFFGYRDWWPADSPFEVCVGAILTQNTSWKNVVKAMDRLKSHDSLDCSTLYYMGVEQLAELIRPAGYYNIKARRLKNFINLLHEDFQADLDILFSAGKSATPPIRPTQTKTPRIQPSRHCRDDYADVMELRRILLSVNGIGKETADSMILYAANRPVFVVDLYTRRVMIRHGLLNENADYDETQELFHRHLKPDTALFNDFHAQFVAVGSRFCGTKPKCEECPLKSFNR